jgi:hypothetical protein
MISLCPVWELWEHGGVLSSYLASCKDEDLLEDVWSSLELLREYGNLCASTTSEALGHGTKLFSLKARSKKTAEQKDQGAHDILFL